MAITVGLDFGTHQTKICIENSDDPHRVTYEFWKWADDGYAFPSVIQINKDHTLSYGQVDIENALIGRKKKRVPDPGEFVLPAEPVEPVLEKVEEPVLPPMPVYEYVTEHGLKFSIPYSDLFGIGRPLPNKSQSSYEIKAWKKKCKRLTHEYQTRLQKWNKYGKSFGIPKPKKPTLPPKPKPQEAPPNIDTEDINPILIASKEQIAEYNRWKAQCAELQAGCQSAIAQNNARIQKFNRMHKEWEKECEQIRRSHEIRTRQYLDSLADYPFVFRYFKQATFSSYKWEYQITPYQLSVLYLAYIIFQLEERFGNEFSIQMGVPADERSFHKLKKFATGYLIQAYRLVENVFENDFEEFLSTPYEKLLELIPKFEYSDELKFEYGIIVLPEAYAALRSLTVNSRIPRGMSIMIDMGGGTTDMSFFVIEDNGEPHIYHFTSIDKGLNYFLEFETLGKPHDFSVKKELEDLSESIFNEAYSSFKSVVDNDVKNLTGFLHVDTISRGFDKKAFSKAIANRPVIYTGGGCYDYRMRKEVLPFSDVLYINNTMLNIQNVIDEQSIDIPYSIMATAYGLCVSIDSDDITVSSKEELFAKYEKVDENEDRWSSHREHGMWEE